MNPKALPGAAKKLLLVLVLGSLFSAGFVGSTLGYFDGETDNPATVAGGWVDSATGLSTVGVTAYDAMLTWTPGTHDVTAQSLWGVDNGTTSSCTGASYAQITTLSAAAATYTDSNQGNASNGNYFCYRIRETHGVWYRDADFAAQRLGLYPTAVAVSSASNANQLSNGDAVTVTYNQNIASMTATVTACAFQTAHVLLLGDSCGAATDTPTFGKILFSGTVAANDSWTNSTVTVSGSTATITLNNGGNHRQGVSGTMTFTAGSAVKSSVVTDQATACTGTPCQKLATGGF